MSLPEHVFSEIVHTRVLDQFGLEVYGDFLELLANGTALRLAEMFATRSAPMMGNSDRIFNETQRRRMSSHHHSYRKRMFEIAARAGIKTEGKYYVGGLGRYDDPKAWVSTHDDVRTAAREKGVLCEGPVRCDYRKEKVETQEGPKGPKLSERLTREMIAHELKQDPATREKVRKNPKSELPALREKVQAKYGRK